jgi:LmbE family N-acetylglucosaminyl deacetylase
MDDGCSARLAFRSVLAVCAHPDDESFGLGAALSTFSSWGVEISLLCFTHGEASTLGPNSWNLATIRADELSAAWALPEAVTSILNSEFGAGFVGRAPSEIDLVVEVNRDRQHQAISCHASQSSNNPVLRRRLALQGSTEWLRWLSSPTDRRMISDL